MKYQELFKENLNPFVLNGVIGRLSFFIINLIISVLSAVAYWIFCPKTLESAANYSISQGKSTLEILLANSPETELLLYILLNLVGMLICFIVNKKRILDILGEKPNSFRLSLIFASVLFLLSLQANFLTPLGSLQASFLSFGMGIIGLILLFKKGEVTGKKINKDNFVEGEISEVAENNVGDN